MSHVIRLKDEHGNWIPIPTIKGDQGPKGDKGDKGDTGIGLQVKGTYATLAALQAAVTDPAIGDMYNVGSAAPFNIYMWNGNAWENQGQLQGPKGDKGDPGQDGADGVDGAPGPNSVSTSTQTTMSGILRGSGSSVQVATEGTHYVGCDSNYKALPERISAPIGMLDVSKTLAVLDAGKLLRITATSAITITIPTNASVVFPIGTEIEIMQFGTGAVTVAPASGVTLCSFESMRSLAGQYASACLKKVDTNTWVLSGGLA